MSDSEQKLKTTREQEAYLKEKLQVSDTKATNPKDNLGSTRIDLSLIISAAAAEEALAYTEGLVKYGRNNYRILGVGAVTYIAAALRHIFKWFLGEDRDPETGVHHLGNARACLGIIIDAASYGKLTDDRPPSNKGFADELNALELRVKVLKDMHKDKNPKHYTIKDSE